MNLDAKVNNEIFRRNHPVIIASNRHLATIYPVRLAYKVDGYLAGEVVGRITADGTYAAYDDGNSDGTEDAAAVLFEDVPVESFESASGTAVARGVFGGEVFKAKLTGLDAAAETDLKARTIIGADGTQVLKF